MSPKRLDVCYFKRHVLFAKGPRSRVERPLSAARKASFEDRDPEDMACGVRQAIQRENKPLQSPEPLSRNTVCLSHTALLPPFTLYSFFYDDPEH